MAETALIVLETLTPATVFGEGGVDGVLATIRREALGAVKDFDISTERGRKEIASVAYKVARSKTALDEMGKELVADLKERTGKIDAERRRLRDECDKIKDEVRKPLTDWEEADKARIAAHEAALDEIERTAEFLIGAPSSAEIAERMAVLKSMAESGRDWQEFHDRARKTALAARGALAQMLETARHREAEEAERERQRQEEAARIQHEREERIAQEAAERVRREAEEAAERERRRVQAEQEAAAVKAAAELAAAQEQAKKQQEAAERAEREKHDAEERATRAAKETEERLRREAAEVAAKEAEELAAREADKKHRAAINKAAMAAFMKGGLSADAAKQAVVLIACKAIPHVAISY